MSLSGRGLSYSRGASVLAALVLVGILGVAYVAFQYAHDSLHLADDGQGAFLAAAGAPTQATLNTAKNPSVPTPQAPKFAGCKTVDGATTCPCDQQNIHPTLSSTKSPESIQGCLPGCIYDITPNDTVGKPPIISTDVSSKSESDPLTSTPVACNYKICSSNGSRTSCGGTQSASGGATATTLSLAASQTPVLSVPSDGSGAPTPSLVGTADTNGGISSAFGNCNTDPALGLPCPSSTNTQPPAGADQNGETPNTLGNCNTDPALGLPCPSSTNTPSPAGADSQSPTSHPCIYSTASIPCVEGVVQNPDLSNVSQNYMPTGTPGSPCSLTGGGMGVTDNSGSCQTSLTQNPDGTCASGGIRVNGNCQPPATTFTQSDGSCVSGGIRDSSGNCQPPADQSAVNRQRCTAAGGTIDSTGNCNGAHAPTTAPAAPAAPAIPNLGDISQFLQGLVKGLIGKGGGSSGSSPSQSAPYGVGTNGAACYQPPVQPDPSTCNVGTWQPTSSTGNGCVTGWQCVPSNSAATQPTATLSCQPQNADVGMTVSISYSCANATGSSGVGFDTQNALSGSTTTVIAIPPAGANTASYGVTCINGTQTASQQCSIQINKPWISLVAIPSTVTQNASSTVGWVTGGMQACTLFTWDPLMTTPSTSTSAISGVTTIFSIATTTPVTLACLTLGGGSMQADTVINVH